MRSHIVFMSVVFALGVCNCSTSSDDFVETPIKPAPTAGYLESCEYRACEYGLCEKTPTGRICTTACVSDAECEGGICVNQLCARKCKHDDYVGPNMTCMDGRPVSCDEPAAKLASCEACGCPDGGICSGNRCVPTQRVVSLTNTAIYSAEIDDGHVYFTTLTEESDPYSSTTKRHYELFQVPDAGGEAQRIYSSSDRIMWVKKHATGSYVYEDYSIYERRLLKRANGATEFLQFAVVNRNSWEPFRILELTSDALWYKRRQYNNNISSSVDRVDLDRTGVRQLPSFYGDVQVAWSPGGKTLDVIVGPFDRDSVGFDVPTHRRILENGSESILREFPDRCSAFFRNLAGEIFAFCSADGKEPDILEFAADGSYQVLMSDAPSPTIPAKARLYGRTLVWDEYRSTTMAALDLGSREFRRTSFNSDGFERLLAFDSQHALLEFTTQSGIEIRRVAWRDTLVR